MNRRSFVKISSFVSLSSLLNFDVMANLFGQQTMPVLFIGHGNPMNAILDNEYTRGWEKLFADIPKPKAVISVSAHWETRGVKMTAVPTPQTIHDFYGYPKALFDVQYPAPGKPDLVDEIQKHFKTPGIHADMERGLDHGTWSVLKKTYPDADIPVIQLSLNKNWTMKEHFEFAQQLQYLRNQGVLVVGSGNIVHNLRMVRFEQNAEVFDWATEFDDKIRENISSRTFDKVIDYRNISQAAELAVNSAEHYLPLLYTIGLSTANDKLTFENVKTDLGSISMTCVKYG